jgi:hypothetical protein
MKIEAHRRAAVATDEAWSERDFDVIGWGVDSGSCMEQFAHLGQIGAAHRVGEQPVVADAMEPVPLAAMSRRTSSGLSTTGSVRGTRTGCIRAMSSGSWRRGGLVGGQTLQGTGDLAQQIGGHLHVERSGLELLVAEQHLDHADIDLLFEQVRREAVPQRMHRHALVELRRFGRGMNGTVQLPLAERIDGIEPGKEILSRNLAETMGFQGVDAFGWSWNPRAEARRLRAVMLR